MQSTAQSSLRGGSDTPFYGPRIIAVAFLVDFIAVGFFFYSFGVFFVPIAADLGGGSRLGVSLTFLVSNIVGALLAPYVGRSLDRHSIKRIMILGAVFVSAGFGALSAVNNLPQYYAVLGTLFGVGLSLMGGMASSKLVANWFVARRGMALGIATMGISFSGLVMPTIATWLIDHVGWRGGFQVYAVCTLAIVVPLVARFAVNRPEDIGQRPDGGHDTAEWASWPASEDVIWRTRDILRSRNFWVLAMAFALAFSGLSAILTHLVPYAGDIGIPKYRAALLLSASAGVGAIGKLAFGRLVDRIDMRLAVWCSFGTQLAGLLLIMRAPSYASLAIGSVVFGFGMGGVIPLQGAIIGATFGRLSFGTVLGLLRPVTMPIHMLGIPLAGWIYDTRGSYDLAFQIFLVNYVAAIAMIGALRLSPRPDWSAAQPPAPQSETQFVS